MNLKLIVFFAAFAIFSSINCNSLYKSIDNHQLQHALSALSSDQIPDYFKHPRDKLLYLVFEQN